MVAPFISARVLPLGVAPRSSVFAVAPGLSHPRGVCAAAGEAEEVGNLVEARAIPRAS